MPTNIPNLVTATRAAAILHGGGVVAVPTETVYGLAADACNPDAVKRVFAIKQRPALDPLIVHITGVEALDGVAADAPPAARQLAATYWPGPLTLVLPKQPCIPDLVTSSLPTVAVRAPAHPVMRTILAQTRCPLAAPSANRFSEVSPTTANHVYASLGSAPDGIVDGGTCPIGLESTIVGFWDECIWLLRPGAISISDIQHTTGCRVYPYSKQHAEDIRAPGTMPRHYAPKTPLFLGQIPSNAPQDRVAHMYFGPQPTPDKPAYAGINLSAQGDLAEAARNLYDTLRSLDTCQADCIVVDPIPATGIGAAINDRLRRAAQFETEKHT